MAKAITRKAATILFAALVVAAIGIIFFVQESWRSQNSAPTPQPTFPAILTQNPASNSAPTQTPIVTSKPTPMATPTLAPTLNPTPTPSPSGTVIVASVALLQPYNPAGPTIEVSLQNNGNTPVTSLQAILTLSNNNYTYIFDQITTSNPLLPGQSVNQTQTLINAGFEQNQTYPLEIIGNQQGGEKINYTTPITIIVPTTPATGGNSELQLSLTIAKTTYSLGENVSLTVDITNVSNQTVSYQHTGLDFDFEVYNDTNNVIYKWSNFKPIPQFIALEPLSAGQSLSENFTWTQNCNFNYTAQGTPVIPGTYYLEGLTGPTYGFQTTPIQITILKP